MPKVLICASTASHINNFHLPYLSYFSEKGIDVHVAVPDPERLKCAYRTHAIPMAKHFLSPKNITAVRMLRKVMRDNRFDLVFTHASLAGAIGRVALLLAGKGTSAVVCTVHGYLFWNGCGIARKAVYYLPELLLKGITDCIITMNDEDAATARKLVKKGGLSAKVSGMGVDSRRFFPASADERRKARETLNIPSDAFVMVYAAEFSKRKNHIELLKAMRAIATDFPNTLLLLCGTGVLEKEVKAEADRLGIRQNIRFMGWCPNMDEIYRACDISISTSRSEGLPFNVVEAQMCALPVVASNIRGHTDLIEDGVNGLLYPVGAPEALANAVSRIFREPGLSQALGTAAVVSSKKYALDVAFYENIEVYEKMLHKNGSYGERNQ